MFIIPYENRIKFRTLAITLGKILLAKSPGNYRWKQLRAFSVNLEMNKQVSKPVWEVCQWNKDVSAV